MKCGGEAGQTLGQQVGWHKARMGWDRLGVGWGGFEGILP